jgi:hypothetical protein
VTRYHLAAHIWELQTPCRGRQRFCRFDGWRYPWSPFSWGRPSTWGNSASQSKGCMPAAAPRVGTEHLRRHRWLVCLVRVIWPKGLNRHSTKALTVTRLALDGGGKSGSNRTEDRPDGGRDRAHCSGSA